jgi:hypothetical protein
LTRIERLSLLGLPLATLGGCLVAVCVRFRTAWPWAAPVHESGTRDLLHTIFYVEHALGELPLELLLAGAVAGSVGAFFAPARSPAVQRRATIWLGAAVLTDLAVIAGALWSVGRSRAAEFLLQYLTRPGAEARFGSHWRYHLLAQVALMALPLVLLGALAFAHRRPFCSAAVGANRTLGASWALLAGLTLAFGITLDPFVDARYLGHAARELFTHSLVTVPLAVAACLSLAHRSDERALAARLLCLGAVAVWAIPALYLATGVVVTASYTHAQTSDPVQIVAGHFFEHGLSYLVVPAHAAVLYVLPLARR